ncbi:Hippocalcin-like protein 1 [Lamellibrachia satsuma]|nr:Hippocalcin-like protein 1 [Lamellibrachia satsuma]
MGNDCSLSPRELTDLETVTAFTQSEIKDWYKQFHKGCPSGRMTKDEFRAMYEEAFKSGNAAQFVDCVFGTYDKDGNGTIDFREFLLSTNLSTRGGIDEKLRWLFHMYDLDDNGYVTMTEVTQMCKGTAEYNATPWQIQSLKRETYINHWATPLRLWGIWDVANRG